MSKLKEREDYPVPYGVCFVGCYSLDLYCANDGHPFREGEASFSGATKAGCYRQARRAGWLLSEKKDLAICPACRKADVF